MEVPDGPVLRSHSAGHGVQAGRIHFDNSVMLAQLSAYPEAAEQDRASAALAHVYRIQAMGFYVEPGERTVRAPSCCG